MKKLLRVTGDGYKAVAVFVKTGEAWQVETTAPILAWMRKLDMAAIRQRLEQQGAKVEWLPCPEAFDAGIDIWLKGVNGAVKQEKRKAFARKGGR